MIGPNQHILGDGAYILTDKVINPYERDEALNEVQQHHNTVLSSCRPSVERSFGFLKMRCPRLKYFRSITIEYAVDHIVSCFVLNNFILEGEEPAGLPGNRQQPPFINGADDVGNFPYVNVEPDHPLLLEARLNGIEKREQIAALLFQRR
ncbi:Hypoxia-inducible factor 1-alpha [Frankliniella fusca]|uniref:Hypoxia-inducible factor 1-alpha n=1 Tax=Frankliniella fusca TaxID=407009 RepID=A0AAE1GS47_9NEOP|nr:Hypoxia-inducible factor 1-alpha [Frankliniella fusca]